MNLLFFCCCCCFLFLAFQVLLIEGPQRKRTRSTSHSRQHCIYEATFQDHNIDYLTEDNDPTYFGSRNLGNGRSVWGTNDEAKDVQPETYWKWHYTPEVYWALKNLEAFASLKVPHKDINKQYYHPLQYGYVDTLIDEAQGLHQVTAPLSTVDKPYSYICCSGFVKVVQSDTDGKSEAYCGHPICYDASPFMTYYSSWRQGRQWTCHPPPINGQPSDTWSNHLCKKLHIRQ